MLLHHSSKGNGPVLVLLHGFCENHSIWKFFETELSKNYWVICPDLPGFGLSRLETEETSMEYMADKVYELLEHYGIRSCTMIGHSLGGYVTLAFAERYVEVLEGIGMFHSTAYADSEERRDARDRSYAFIQKRGVSSFVEMFVPPLFQVLHRKRLATEIRETVEQGASSSLKGVLATILAMRDRHDRSTLLSQLTIPVLYIIGKHDSSVPYDKSLEQVKLLQHPDVHIIEDCGHMGMIEQPEETLGIVRGFLEKHN